MNIAILRKPEHTDEIPIYPGTKDPARVRVKYLNDDEQKQVTAIADALCAEGRVREEALRIGFGRVSVKGFYGIDDGNDTLQFTEENVDFLMLNVRAFRTAVLTAATTLQRDIEKN